jgi:DNA anti-recombination protein RmuC
MPTATDDRLSEVRGRIARLEVTAQQGTAAARHQVRQYVDSVLRAERSARAAVHERAAAVDGSLEHLHNELALATHRVAAEFATTAEEFRDAVDAKLRRWDVVLDRKQANAAARTPPARERAEAVIAELRQHRLAIEEDLADARETAGSGWLDTKSRVLQQLDELKRKADAAS